MRKVTEVLRLRFGLGLKQTQIARSCSIGQATVHRYLERAEAVGLSWPLPDGCDERRLQELLFGKTLPEFTPGATRTQPDFALVCRQLQSSKHVTLHLLWEEYREQNPDGYLYSRFCELYQRWRRTQNVVLRQVHKAGEKTFVDWAGATIPIYDRVTGEVHPASLFVAVLGLSSYTFACATLSQNLAQWLDCHTLAFEFFQGTTE
jgi:transposase